MLVLARKKEQRILIDGGIVITVLSVDGDRVRLGIEAPADITVLREEIHREVGSENRRSARSAADREGLERSVQALGAIKQLETRGFPPSGSQTPSET